MALNFFAVACQKTPPEVVTNLPLQWEKEGSLLLRYENSDHSVLLLARVSHEQRRLLLRDAPIQVASPIYAFDGTTNRITVSSVDVWNDANGLIMDCVSHAGTLLDGLSVSQDGKAITLGGSALPICGRYVYFYQQSPEGGLLAVVPALGRKGFSVMPFIGEAPPSGPYCHQVFSTKDKVQIGKAITLGGSDRKKHPMQACWTEGNKHVVYADSELENVWIVKVGDE